ncbi:unnamed protein product [Dovyalis caffra]|uniref:Uncharacterized protein n=1 Tax=Dovyalis caffra TaxID=77055 RepID=A0AAV1QQ29_9ROSI|nr:unnamed protein product [Dovyalis caffra]
MWITICSCSAGAFPCTACVTQGIMVFARNVPLSWKLDIFGLAIEQKLDVIVRRIMEGHHRMGMVVIIDSASGSLADFACEVEITESKVAEDLAFFDLGIKMGELDLLLKIEWVQDIPPEGLEQRTEELTNSAAEYAQSWLRRAKEAARQDRRRFEKLLNVEAMMPTPLDPERFSFWLATLTDRRPYERLELLRVRDTKEDTKLDDGQTFKSDYVLQSYLETNVEITRLRWHWLFFYFHSLPHPVYNLTSAVFSITTDEFVLLHDFFVKGNSISAFEEYLFNVSNDRFSLIFNPKERSFAFINAIEVVSTADGLVSDSAFMVPQGGTLNGLFKHAFEVCYRLNVGGPTIIPMNDTLSRTGLLDTAYNVFPQGAKNASITPGAVKYP